MTAPVVVSLTLPPDARSVGRARQAVREVLPSAGQEGLLESAQLAISELVTNAVVHAGTEIEVRIVVAESGVRVEVTDGSVHLPVPRAWSPTAGTGRGLHVVAQSAERWGVESLPAGKTVWFESGQSPMEAPSNGASSESPGRPVDDEVVPVTLLDAPLLMHRAWQEHAATLLREYLLLVLERDPDALEVHATASAALSILGEQLPAPGLPADPDRLMADLVEPHVTANKVTMRVPRAAVAHFAVLDDVLRTAVEAAKEGLLLSPPTQPEIGEMRAWLCGEIAAQAAGSSVARAWRARTDVRVPSDERAKAALDAELASLETAAIATDEALVIVAVTASVVRFLGYADASELVGRRILALIPGRYHQAHIAGVTFHATNGRDALLDRWITVPVVRSDGSEVAVELMVEPRKMNEHHRVFVATFRLDDVPTQE